jgi:hypothetical protein
VKKTIAMCTLLIVLAASVGISCKKSSAKDQTSCKTCKVFGGDGPNNVIHEEKVCSDAQQQQLQANFPGREIKCQ